MAEENNKSVVIERVFDAAVERVWRAWTEPEMIKKWWGPKDFTAPVIKNDFRVGGKALYAMHGPPGTEWDKDMWSVGTYKEIVPMKKIIVTDNFADEKGNVVPGSYYGMPEGPPAESLITATFEEIDGKTKLTLNHEGLDDDSGAEGGWNESLDKFASLVEK
jgi:uncharacterized protein YndB with AHSA1/START domain